MCIRDRLRIDRMYIFVNINCITIKMCIRDRNYIHCTHGLCITFSISTTLILFILLFSVADIGNFLPKHVLLHFKMVVNFVDLELASRC